MSHAAMTNVEIDDEDGYTLKIQVWKKGHARYLVHGLDDVLWTNSLNDGLAYLKQELLRYETGTQVRRVAAGGR